MPETLKIEDMHSIVGAIDGALEMTERDRAALALIAPPRMCPVPDAL